MDFDSIIAALVSLTHGEVAPLIAALGPFAYGKIIYGLVALILFPLGFWAVRKGSVREGRGSILSALSWGLFWALMWPTIYGGWWAISGFLRAVQDDNDLIRTRQSRPAGKLTDQF